MTNSNINSILRSILQKKFEEVMKSLHDNADVVVFPGQDPFYQVALTVERSEFELRVQKEENIRLFRENQRLKQENESLIKRIETLMPYKEL